MSHLKNSIVKNLVSLSHSLLHLSKIIFSHSPLQYRSTYFIKSLVLCFVATATLFYFPISLANETPAAMPSATKHGATNTANTATNTAKKTIGISQIVEHPALDAVRQGMLAELKRQGFQENNNLQVVYENAQGSVVTSTQIANKLLSSPLDVGIAISTPSAQTLFFSAQKQGKKIPIVFSAVSDPLAAKLDPGKDQKYPITGVTDAPNLPGLLELMEYMLPKIKTLGIMYNPSEANSVATVKNLKKLLAEKGIKAHEATVTKTADVAQVTQSLIGKVDALYFPQDNTVVAAIETVVGIAGQAKPTMPVILPIFTNDPILVKKGVLAAVGFDYTDIGTETGKVVARILQGEKAEDIPIQNPQQLKSVINRSLAEKLNLKVPEKLKYSEIEFIN